MVCQLASEAEAFDQLGDIDPATLGKRSSYDGVSIVEVVVLRTSHDLDARDVLDEIVDVIVPAVLTVGDDVHPGVVLVHERRLDGDLLDLGQSRLAQPATVVTGLEPPEPVRHRVRPHHRGPQQSRDLAEPSPAASSGFHFVVRPIVHLDLS